MMTTVQGAPFVVVGQSDANGDNNSHRSNPMVSTPSSSDLTSSMTGSSVKRKEAIPEGEEHEETGYITPRTLKSPRSADFTSPAARPSHVPVPILDLSSVRHSPRTPPGLTSKSDLITLSPGVKSPRFTQDIGPIASVAVNAAVRTIELDMREAQLQSQKAEFQHAVATASFEHQHVLQTAQRPSKIFN